MSNRCGHNKKKFRFCDLVKRGKGGQPRVLGIISAQLADAAKKRSRLKAWQFHQPTAGQIARGRRSESREAGIAVLQFLTGKWLQLETRRCAMPGTEFLECPDVNYLANAISKSPDWQGKRLSKGRIYGALKSLCDAGYITRSKQKREQTAGGLWIASPKITTFTKKFFLDLGGKRLWRLVLKTGKLKLDKMRHRLAKAIIGNDPRALGDYLSPRDVVSPKRARFLRQIRPPNWSDDRPHLPAKIQFAG